jgi:hypothetical protein
MIELNRDAVTYLAVYLNSQPEDTWPDEVYKLRRQAHDQFGPQVADDFMVRLIRAVFDELSALRHNPPLLQ